MKTANLHDRRLNERLRVVLSQLAERPTASIPAACGGHAEMTAAYRLFDNSKATFKRILAPHAEATRQRMAAQSVAILAQDTSEVDLTRPEQLVVGAGPLDGSTRVGALLHLLHAFTPDGTPLGTLDAMAWTRGPQTVCAGVPRSQRAKIPIEEKESYRWVAMLRQARDLAADCPSTCCVCVADSEADIYEYLLEATREPRPVPWVVRACQNRALAPKNAAENELGPLRERALAEPVLFRQTIHVRGRTPKISSDRRARRQARVTRQAEVSVRAVGVTLRGPWRPGGKLPDVPVHGVIVRENDPPAGEEPVEWLLLTSLPIDTVEQVRQVIQYYCVRWMIEVFFRVLKSGCRVEQRHFEHVDRVLSCLAVYMIVAWRTLYVCRLGRACPEISCQAVFESAEWKATWKIVQGEDPPREPPPLGLMIRLVAQLGGYVNRPRAAPPGPQTLWIGLQRVYDFALCWRRFGPETRIPTKLV